MSRSSGKPVQLSQRQKWIAAIASIVGYFALAVWLDRSFVDTKPQGKLVGRMLFPFENYGHANIATRTVDDYLKERVLQPEHFDERVKVKVFEDGRELGPDDTSFIETRDLGEGRFLRVPGQVIFSSSDGTDPAYNKRVYWLVVP